jgi:SnoaL-like domain
VERARRGYELLNGGEIDRFATEFVDPDYEFHTGVHVPSIPSVVRGRDELRAWIKQWYEEPWEEQLIMDVESIEELDDGRVLALLTLRAKGRESRRALGRSSGPSYAR